MTLKDLFCLKNRTILSRQNLKINFFTFFYLKRPFLPKRLNNFGWKDLKKPNFLQFFMFKTFLNLRNDQFLLEKQFKKQKIDTFLHLKPFLPKK